MAGMQPGLKQLLIHLSIILVLFTALIFGFFYIYLPNSTHHGETIEVPNLEGMSMIDLEDFLDKKNLRFQVSDCTFAKDKKPLTILSQYPKPGIQVKENRRIYITVSALSPPKVKMPNLVDASLKNAQFVLQSYDLVLDKVKFVPHFAKNAVLKQYLGNKEIKPGEYLPKGSKINIIVGDGLSQTLVATPSLVGLDYSEVGGILEGMGLELGSVVFSDDTGEEPGTIIKQKPAFSIGDSLKKGQFIDIWVAGKDPRQNVIDINDSLR